MEMWMLFVAVLLILVLLGWIVWWWNDIWHIAPVKARYASFNTKLPPGDLGLPYFGENFKFLWFFERLRRPDDFITSKRLKYGDNVGIYRSHLYGNPTIIACSPALCKLVLNSTDVFLSSWPTTEIIGPNSVLSLHGPRHDLIKGCMMNSITRPEALARVVSEVQPNIVAALQSWSQEGKLTTFSHAKRVTLDYMARYISGLELGPEIDAYVKLFSGVNSGSRSQPWNIPGTTYHHGLKCKKTITMVLKEELERRKMSNHVRSETSTCDVMDDLMRMKDKEGRPLSEEEVLDNVLSCIDVGHAAIAYALTWAMYFLAKNPLALQKLREENKDMFQKKNGEHITYADILKLKYTNKVVEETIRSANLSGFIFRKGTQDVNYQGYLIPKGWLVIVWLRYLQTDPANFEDPMTFNPDRWDAAPKHGTYLPFGGGSKTCPGSKLAKANVTMFLHHLSVGYKWELLNPDAPIKYLSHPLPTDGLKISFSQL